jgi:hypothetical protein
MAVLGGFMDDDIFADVQAHAMNALESSSGWLSESDSPYTAQRNRVLAAL